MATNKNKSTGVNRVRKLSQPEDLSLGSKAKQLEDEIKKPRKKATKIDTGKKTQAPSVEDTYIKKGRRAKAEKQKEYKDRHVPRKSELEKEYTKELQKLRNRLKYREKQGFKVKWETAPTRPRNITVTELEKLKQYDVRLTEGGDIEAYRKEYSKTARDMTEKLRLKYTELPNYSIENDPNFVPPKESVQHFDVFERIWDALVRNKSMVQYDGTEIDHPINEDIWIALSECADETYDIAISTFKSLRDSPKRQEYADYLYAHEDEVTDAIEDAKRGSTQAELIERREYLLKWLEM